MTLPAPVVTTDSPAQDPFAREWDRWHDAHEERRADPHGFLAVTGLFWLTAEPRRFPGLPGEWFTGVTGPVVVLAEDEALTVDGAEATGTHAFGPLAERGGVTVGFEGGVVEVAKRGGQDLLRPRRPDFPFLSAYTGTAAFPPDPRWRITGRFVRFVAPRAIEVGAAVDGLSHVYDSPGYVEFVLDDEPFRLLAFRGHEPGALFALFTDATSGVTTYAANRTVSFEVDEGSDAVVIDFNRATNLPCAYTDFATCPLPPAENRLGIPVTAGERTPERRVHAEVSAEGLVPRA
ncbi:DUF1684 domain-containing protein [Microbacterium azadirachtae]|uniref:DUF1684 domain-containing protein n=1 Tax=Microbacterium azadirachtae TaxID=582680 RepID=UPI0021D4937D|nr:DUF1684 domain-containing protein [Microbacterium azadirachtae]UXW86464.1 DUF1684 domain-containing protein [Microbacterium azadirachtae]